MGVCKTGWKREKCWGDTPTPLGRSADLTTKPVALSTHFTLPAVIPLVRVLWKRMKKTIHGSKPNRADALEVVTSILCWPCKMAIANGTVQRVLETSKTIGRKNSFHVQMKKKTNNTVSEGMLLGETILNNSCHLLQPSIKAASIISLGKALNIEDNR